MRGPSRENSSTRDDAPPPPLPRKPMGHARDGSAPHPLSQIHNSSQQSIGNSPNALGGTQTQSTNRRPTTGSSNSSGDRPPPPPPRRRGTPSSITEENPPLPPRRTQTSTSLDLDFEPLPPPKTTPPPFGTSRSGNRSGNITPSTSPTLGPQVVNKKLELWRRRLARAHEQLDGLGVSLYTWRKGQDVINEAEGIIKQALRDMERKRKG